MNPVCIDHLSKLFFFFDDDDLEGREDVLDGH